MFSKTVLFAAVVLAVEAIHNPHIMGRADHPDHHIRHREMQRHHEQQFLQFVALTRTCLKEVFPKTGLPEDQQKVLLDMIRPIVDLEREQRMSVKKDDESDKDKPGKTPARPVYTPPPPPFKCTDQGEVVHLTPAEIYVRAMVKILEKTDKISERQKAQESMQEALPCMDKMFKKENLDQQTVAEAPADQTQVAAG